jgi:hypothetical protein
MLKLFTILFYLVIAAFAAMVGIEWAAGCGEVTYHANHTYTSNECVFINNRTTATGRW